MCFCFHRNGSNGTNNNTKKSSRVPYLVNKQDTSLVQALDMNQIVDLINILKQSESETSLVWYKCIGMLIILLLLILAGAMSKLLLTNGHCWCILFRLCNHHSIRLWRQELLNYNWTYFCWILDLGQ